MRFPDTHDLLQIAEVYNTLGATFSSTEFFCFQKTIFFFIERTNLFTTQHNTTQHNTTQHNTVMLILWMVLTKRGEKKSERETESQILPKYIASAPVFHLAKDHFLSFTLLKAS